MSEKTRKNSSDLISDIIDALISDSLLSQAYEISSKSIEAGKMSVDEAIKFLEAVYINENKRIEHKEKFIISIIDKVDTKIDAIMRLSENEKVVSLIMTALQLISNSEIGADNIQNK